MNDVYASEAETQALLVPDTRMKAERKLAQMMAERGADEQGAEAYLILRQIALELLAEQPYEIGARLAREGKGISEIWGCSQLQRRHGRGATWVGLTDQEIENLWNQHESRFDYYSFSCDIEAKLKEKNT